MSTARRSFLTAILLLTMATPVFADGPGLPTAVRVEAGFDGLAKAGKWVPVAVTLKNEGAEFTGELRFESKSQFGPDAQVTVYRTPVVIPAGGTKRVQLHMPLEGLGSGAPAVTLASADGRQTAEVPVKLESGWDMVIGVLGVEPEELKGITGMTHGSQAVRLARLDPAAMPAEALELENLDALLLDRFAWNELPEPQRQAIEAWVEHGGTLIAAGGSEAKRLEGLASWLPLGVKGVQPVAVDGVGTAPIAQFDLSQGGWKVTRTTGNMPLIARLGKGAGTVHLLAFDPALEPFASWSGLPGLIDNLLPPGLSNPGMGQNPGAMKAQWMMMDMLINFPVEQAPVAKGLLVMLGTYALLIGPVHFLLLRGFRRLGWALLSLPLVAAVGAGGAWGYAREIKRSDVMMNTISLIQGQPNGRFLKVSSLTGIHMPPQSTHAIALGDALLQAVTRPPMQGPNGVIPDKTAAATVVEQGRSARLAPLDEWQMRGVAAEGMVPVADTVVADITITHQRAEGRLTSRLPFPLKDALVVGGTGFQKIGDLNPGDGVNVSVSLPNVAQDFRGRNMLAEAIGRAYQPTDGMGGPEGMTREQFILQLRQQISWAAVNSLGVSQSGNETPLMLVGWAERPPLPISVDQQQFNTTGLGLYIQPLPFTFGRDAMTVSEGFVPGRVSQWSGGGPFPGLNFGWSLAEDQWVAVDFDLPEALAGRVDELEASVSVLKQAPGTKHPISTAFYRWSDGAWVDFGGSNLGVNPVTDSGFVSPAGTVRMRITQIDEQQWPLGVPTLTVRVKEAQS